MEELGKSIDKELLAEIQLSAKAIDNIRLYVCDNANQIEKVIKTIS